jgi:hypothetical protein
MRLAVLSHLGVIAPAHDEWRIGKEPRMGSSTIQKFQSPPSGVCCTIKKVHLNSLLKLVAYSRWEATGLMVDS